MTDFETLIVAKTDWQSLNKIPMGRGPLVQSLKEKLNVDGHGVYQLTLREHLLGADIISEHIGYTGMSSNVFARVTGIKNGKHNAGKMVHRQGFKFEDVMLRYLFTTEGNEKLLETAIHTETAQKFGYRFKWRDASGGTDGISTRIIMDMDKVDNPAELINIIRKAEERWTFVTLQAAKDGTLKDLINDYFPDESEE